MKRIYKKFLGALFQIPLKLEVFKTWVSEWVAIFRKRPLYKNVKWTKEQQKEFDNFWKENYGRKISNRWHKLYEACNGVHRVDYLPEIIYTTRIEPKVNDIIYSTVYDDKNLTELFFDNRLEGVRTPRWFLANIHGKFYDQSRNLISREKAVQIFGNVGKAVLKPSVGSSSGKNVLVVDMVNGVNVRTGDTVENLLDTYKSNFVLQEKIVSCEELARLYDGSINTFRITSYVCGENIEIATASLRVGANGSEVDNVHAGGLSIAVKEDGFLNEFAYRLGYGDSFQKFDKHPNSNIKFAEFQTTLIQRMIDVAKQLHKLIVNIEIVSWDLTMDADGNVVVIEANFKGQGVWLPQMLSGESFYGDKSVFMLNQYFNRKQ